MSQPGTSLLRSSVIVVVTLLLFASCATQVNSSTQHSEEVSVTSPLLLEQALFPSETATASQIPSPTPEQATTGQLAPTATESAQKEQLIVEQINELIDGEDGNYSVVVVAPDGNTLYRHEPDTQMEAASLYKLAIMVELFRQRDAGMLSFENLLYMEPAFFAEGSSEIFQPDEFYSVDVLLEQMITISSNVASYALLTLVETENVNETVRALGLTDTEIRWNPLVAPEVSEDQRRNVTSAGDIVLLFRLLLAGEVVSNEASMEMLDLLKQQTINDRLPYLLPPGIEVAHKTGNLDGVDHDVGIIYTENGPMIVTVLSEGVDEANATEIIAQIGYFAYQYGSE